MDERKITEELNQNRANAREQGRLQTEVPANGKSPNTGIGIVMLMLAILGFIPGIGAIVRGALKLQQSMGHPKAKNRLVSKLPGNVSNVWAMFFTKSK